MKAVRIHENGGADVLRYEDVPTPTPAGGQARVRLLAAGVNFIDVYHRVGLYPNPLPLTLGQEGAGIVEEVASDLSTIRAGDVVAWSQQQGSYAEQVLVRADRVVKVPDDIEPRIAAAIMLQGLTAHYLATSTYPLQHGDWCVVHAAAGGVGLLLCQIAQMRGARVIGTTSTEEKANAAREAGAAHVVLYTKQNLVEEVKRITGGRGVQVVYDSVGKTTFESSLDCLATRGMLVLFGQSSGPVGTFDPQVLNRKGSLFLTRPTLGHYIATTAELNSRAADVFGWIRAGRLNVHIDRELPLSQAADAQRALESRQTSGKVLLVP